MEDACWNWAASTNGRGYGRVRVNGKLMGAHRVAYETANGPIPQGLHVLHRCDNPACVNPDHLFLGSHRENMQDMAAKKRNFIPAGDACGRAKLDWGKIGEIRSSTKNVSELARQFGVSRKAIRLILDGKTWRSQ